jgi:hypothetical protein
VGSHVAKTIESIKRSDFDKEVLPLIKAIFAEEKPIFSSPFSESVCERRILFDWRFKYSVEEPLISSLVKAAEFVGDSGFYLRSHLPQDDEAVAWYVPFSEIALYTQRQGSPLRTATTFEQTLISPSAQWGILTSHETHMLLGSTEKFMSEFKKLVPDIDNQIFQFLEHWEDVKNGGGSSVESWMPGLMNQIYGSEVATEMLTNAGLP